MIEEWQEAMEARSDGGMARSDGGMAKSDGGKK